MSRQVCEKVAELITILVVTTSLCLADAVLKGTVTGEFLEGRRG